MSFYSRFASSRMASGLTQREIADKIGVKFQSVQKWEYGKTEPRLSRFKALSELLGVRREWLLTGKKDQQDVDIGLRIKARRRELQFKRSLDNEAISALPSAAKECGLHLLRYSMIEKGEARATLNELESIAEAFATELNVFIKSLSPTTRPSDLGPACMDYLPNKDREWLELIHALTPEKEAALKSVGVAFAQQGVEKDAGNDE